MPALLWLMSSFLGLAHAQLSISADVDKTAVALNDQIVLGVTVTGPEASLPDPEIPAMPNFSIYSSGRNQNITFVNGRVSSSITFTYVLEPRALGRGVIPPITLTYKGQQAHTNPIEIQVFKPGAPVPAQQRGPAPVSAQIQQAPAPTPTPSPGPGRAPPQVKRAVINGSPVFVQAQVDKKSAYVNEQITLTIRFCTAVSLLSAPQYNAPKTDGFLAEDLPPERHGSTDIGGRTYTFSEIKTALFPAQAGRLTVSPASVRVQMQQNVNVDPTAADFFERFMSGAFVNAITRDLNSEPVIVEAQALPADGKPKDFSGAVGAFRVSAAVDRSSVKVGDAVNLTVTISGTGNIKAIGDPQMPDLTNFRVYDTVTSLNLDRKDDKVQGSKVFKTVLVPRVSGDLAIPPVAFTYFDPEKKSYVKAESLPLTVKSAPSPGGPAVPAGNPVAGVVAPQGVTTVSEDIRYLQAGRARPISRFLEAVAGAGPLHAVPIFAFAFCLGLVQYRKLGSADPAGSRFRGAAKTASAKIGQSLKASDPGKAAGLMADALAKYLADKLAQPASGLTARRVADLLTNRMPPVDAALIERVKEMWDELDMRRFSPNAPGGGAPVADSLRELIDALEKELKR